MAPNSGNSSGSYTGLLDAAGNAVGDVGALSGLAGMVAAGSGAQVQMTMEAVWAGQRRFPPEYTRLLGPLQSKPSAFFNILSKTAIGFLPFFGRDLSDDQIAGELQINSVHGAAPPVWNHAAARVAPFGRAGAGRAMEDLRRLHLSPRRACSSGPKAPRSAGRKPSQIPANPKARTTGRGRMHGADTLEVPTS